MKKVIGIVLNILGALTFIGGVANLFLSFTDKQKVLAVWFVMFLGMLLVMKIRLMIL